VTRPRPPARRSFGNRPSKNITLSRRKNVGLNPISGLCWSRTH
jgi:hypothetical protein